MYPVCPIAPLQPESLGGGGATRTAESELGDQEDWTEDQMGWTGENLGRNAVDWVVLDAQLKANIGKILGNSWEDAKCLEFYKGLAAGFFGNPCDTAKDLWGFGIGAAKVLGKVAWNLSPYKVPGEFTGGDRFQGEIQAATRMAHKVKNAAAIAAMGWNQVLEFMQTLTPDKIHAFLTTGIWPGENRVEPHPISPGPAGLTSSPLFLLTKRIPFSSKNGGSWVNS